MEEVFRSKQHPDKKDPYAPNEIWFWFEETCYAFIFLNKIAL